MPTTPIPAATRRNSERRMARAGVTMGIIASLLGLFGCDQVLVVRCDLALVKSEQARGQA